MRASRRRSRWRRAWKKGIFARDYVHYDDEEEGDDNSDEEEEQVEKSLEKGS